MDFRIIPESLPDSVKTGYLLRDMSLGEVVRITRAALNKIDYGARNTHKIELWVRNEYDKQGNIDYLKHMINCGKLRYKDILDIFKFYNPFLELDPTRPIDWLDTMMRDKKKEEVFLTDDFDYVPVPKKVVITNPRWEHKDATKKENSPKKAAFDDTVILMADVTGVPENGLVTFEIFDTSVKPPKAVGNAQGKNVGGVAKGEWVVTDMSDTGEDAKLEFQASAKSRISTRCTIPLTVVPKLWFHIDLDNPVTDDDRIIIKATDDSSEDIIYLKDMKESKEDMVLLAFPTMKDGKRYNLIYDPGAEGEPVIFEHDIDRQYLLS